MLVYLVTGLFIILSSIYFYWKSKTSFWERRGVPSLPTSFPMGNMAGIGKTIHWAHRFQEIYEAFKNKSKVGGFYFLTSPRLVVTDLNFLKTVLVKDFNSFRNRGLFFNEEFDPLSGHLFNSENEKWKNLRTKLSPTFTSGKMKTMFPIVGAKTQELVNHIAKYAIEKTAMEVRDVCVRYTADVIGACAFGLECNCLIQSNAEFMVEANRVFDFKPARRQLEFFIQNTFKSLAVKLKLRQTTWETEKYFMGIVNDAVKHRENNPAVYNDFLNILLNIYKHGIVKGETDEEVGKITFNEMAAQSFLFFFAGFETTSTTLYYALYELARNQDIQEKARDEATEISSKYNGNISYEACMESVYIGQIINETLRLHDPVHTLMRESAEEYTIPETDIIIPKETQLIIPVYAIHHDPDIYPESEIFDPDRFTPENIKSRHPFGFIPFGDGPRNCIGMRFALLELRIALAELLINFKFTVNEKTDKNLKLNPRDFVMTVCNGIWLNAEKI